MLDALLTPAALAVLGKVIAIDLMLAGDNVVILGALAAQLPKAQRSKAIQVGVAISLVFLITLSFIALKLLRIVGVLFAGGLLLLWVAWKLFRELTHKDHVPEDYQAASVANQPFSKMILQVVIADLSMSLENVLAVAGAARNYPVIMVFGLVVSVTIMGLAANVIANIIERHRWIAFVGLVMILWVAYGMIRDGWLEVYHLGRHFA